MRINTDDRFLSLERIATDSPSVVWQVQATVASESCVVAVHDRVTVQTTKETQDRLADLTTRRAGRLEVMLSKGGWLRLNRASDGGTLIRYRLGRLIAGTSLEGEVRLEGESAEACSRESGGLV